VFYFEELVPGRKYPKSGIHKKIFQKISVSERPYSSTNPQSLFSGTVLHAWDKYSTVQYSSMYRHLICGEGRDPLSGIDRGIFGLLT